MESLRLPLEEAGGVLPLQNLREASTGRNAAIQVWWASARADDLDLLADVERSRIARSINPLDRACQATSRVLRRTILAEETAREPQDLSFSTYCEHCNSNDHGRPQLVGTKELCFSVSHAGSIAALAVAREFSVGVDIERVASEKTWDEVRGIVRNAGDDKSLHLAQLWTAKEAALKMIGIGLALPLKAVSVQRCAENVGRALIELPAVQVETYITWFYIDAAHSGAVATSVIADFSLKQWIR